MKSSKLFVVATATLVLVFAAHPACAQAASTPTVKPAAKASQAARPAARPVTKQLRAEPLPPQVDETFKLWDADHDGSLSQQEFRNGWRGMRRAVKVRGSLQKQFNSVDTNNNKAIDAAEYGHLVLVQKAGKSAPPLSAYDANKNQRLEFSEYVDLVRRMSERRTTLPASTGKTTTPAH